MCASEVGIFFADYLTHDVVARLPHPPIIRHGPVNQTVYEGETVSFECQILSDLHPHVQWLSHYMVNGSYVNENGTAYVTALAVSCRIQSISQLGPNIITEIY